MELTLKEEVVSEEGAGEPGQPGDQEQAAGGEQDTPVIKGDKYLL